MHLTDKLDECKTILRTAIASKAGDGEVFTKLSSHIEGSAECDKDFEIVFRSLLDNLLVEDTMNNGNEFEQTIALLKYAFDFALQHSSESVPISKVPFFLLEDIFEFQTISQAESTWAVVESLEDKITNPELFAKGKLVILKTCNSILRKLSKSCHTEFCGRILLFLAAIYPISERSAVNLPGKINSSNITYFDDADTFRDAFSANGAVRDGSEDAAAMKVDGEEGEEVEAAHTVEYELYSSFWKLQSFFAADNKNIEKAETWHAFAESARKVFSMLDSKGKAEDKLSSSSQSEKAASSSSTSVSSDTYLGCKFLTSSQLFNLQLRDATLRQQVAVQILYFLHFIRARLPQSLPDGILPVVSKDLLHLHNRAVALIESTPGGAELLRVVQRLIGRENQWLVWKANSCPAFEKGVAPAADDEARAAAATATKRRWEKTVSEAFQSKKRVRPAGRGASSGAAAAAGRGYQFDCSDANVREKAKGLLSHLPEFREHIQQYIDADDPECGIEEEYHPKHDAVYCWRTRRLLAAHRLSLFQVMADGNLSRGLRKLDGKPEPEEVVEPPTVATAAVVEAESEVPAAEESATVVAEDRASVEGEESMSVENDAAVSVVEETVEVSAAPSEAGEVIAEPADSAEEVAVELTSAAVSVAEEQSC